MKRIVFIALSVLLILSVTAVAQDESDGPKIVREPAFRPKSPEFMAQGGSYTAVARSYNALFTNPAGYGRKPASLTIVNANPWVYANPDELNTIAEQIEAMEGEGEGAGLGGTLQALSGQITGNGFGVGASSGIAFVGHGIALGVVSVVDSYIWGEKLLGATGDLHATVAFIGGLSLPLKLFGTTLRLGGDVRPMVRVHAPIRPADMLALVGDPTGGDGAEAPDPLDALGAYHGMALAIDLGAMWEVGPFNVGLSIRDFGGTRFRYSRDSLNEILSSLEEGHLPPSDGTNEVDPEKYQFVTPMQINLGAAFHPDLGAFKFLLDPSFHVDLRDPISVFRDKQSPWALLHLGTEVKLLSLLKLRAGLSQGYITMGAGLKFLFADVNVAVFTQELGKYPGDRPRTGVSAEAAIRF
jgi:hypothetical protein